MKKKVVTLAVFIFSFAAGIVLAQAQSREMQAKFSQQGLLEATSRQETRPTQDPATYTDPYTVEAYTAAREIPGALDKVFCYCYCALNEKFKHKSLLTCYVDDHGAKCGICMREAVVTKQLTAQGKKPEEIAKIFADYYLNQSQQH
jgi:hypothetical protein